MNKRQKKLLIELKKLGCWKNEDPFKVREVREIIKILFPEKTKTIRHAHNSYGYKHLFERIAGHCGVPNKYCSEGTVKKAFKSEGFRSVSVSRFYECYNAGMRNYIF